jgi:hypothetical protein
VKHGLAVGASDENSIERDEVQVWIELEVGGNPLHDGRGTALAAGRAFDLHAAAVPPEDGIDEDARDRHRRARGRRIRGVLNRQACQTGCSCGN